MSTQPQLNQRRKRLSSSIPFGWKLDETDPKFIVPIPEELELLKQAHKYLDEGCTQEEATLWLIHKSGRHITRRGLVMSKERGW